MVKFKFRCLFLSFQVHDGANLSDLQCVIYHRAVYKICKRDTLLDGKYGWIPTSTATTGTAATAVAATTTTAAAVLLLLLLLS